MGDRTCPTLGHPEVFRNTSSHSGTLLDGTKEADATYCINHFEGFLGTCEPRMLDLSLLPECVVSIYLAENSVCVDAKGVVLADGSGNKITEDATSPAPVYALSNIY